MNSASKRGGRARARLAAVITALVLGSCDGTTEPEFGSLMITLTTVGGDVDLDGYWLIIDDGDPAPVGLAFSVTVPDLPVGPHTVALEGYEANCELSRAPLRPVLVNANATTRVELEVLCFPTGIAVSATTTGPDPDADGYSVQIGQLGAEPLGSNGSVTRTRLEPGSYDVRLASLAENCSITGPASVTVEVEFRRLTSVNFAITCTATTGVIEVTAMTAGVDDDPSGYLVRVDGVASQGIGADQIIWLQQIPPGQHTVGLDQVASNCTATNPLRSVVVTAGTALRDTVRITFTVTCNRVDKIAFVRVQAIIVTYADGSEAVTVAGGWKSGPSWSPNGLQLVYQRVECGYYYYYYSDCFDAGLAIAGTIGPSVQVLTTIPADRHPAWGPDGTTIAFERDGRLRLISSAGVPGPVLSPAVDRATQPSWSPDGTRLAFTCKVEPAPEDICVIGRDGSGFARLTQTSEAESDPAWSPDGGRIAFTHQRLDGSMVVRLMATDGSQVTEVTAGSSPAWVRDGSRLLFTRFGGGISSVSLDGTGLLSITTSNDDGAAWRP